MRFLRHLTAVMATVAVIVGLGMLWAHAASGGTTSGGAPSGPLPREVLLRARQIKDGVVTVHSGTGFHLTDSGNLIRTCIIEALLAALVITVSTGVAVSGDNAFTHTTGRTGHAARTAAGEHPGSGESPGVYGAPFNLAGEPGGSRVGGRGPVLRISPASPICVEHPAFVGHFGNWGCLDAPRKSNLPR